jgi:putative Mg2+ transporter-C (MgtC) family protein
VKGAGRARQPDNSPPRDRIAFRLLLAACLGGALGLDRERLEQPAGLRTHMLTALAAAVFTVLTFEIYAGMLKSAGSSNSGDPIRIIEAVTAGVAFLAAGAIFRSQGDVYGLTTGAGMWLAGAIGVACGAGYYVLAVMATLLAAFIVAALRRLEQRLDLKPADDAGTAIRQGRVVQPRPTTAPRSGDGRG